MEPITVGNMELVLIGLIVCGALAYLTYHFLRPVLARRKSPGKDCGPSCGCGGTK